MRWIILWVLIRRSSNWYGANWGVRYGAGLYMLCFCLLWRCQWTYARSRPGGLLSSISRCVCHWAEHWVSRYFLYDFSLFCGCAVTTFCGIGELGSARGGSMWQIAVCIRSSRERGSRVFNSGCHSFHMKYCIEVGGEELIMNRSWANRTRGVWC